MKSSAGGVPISAVEVTNISAHGIWVWFADEELFLPYAEFPWFRTATVEQILDVRAESVEHLRWPQLDVDIALDSIRHPAKYPLVDR